MKKLLALLLAIALIASLAACGGGDAAPSEAGAEASAAPSEAAAEDSGNEAAEPSGDAVTLRFIVQEADHDLIKPAVDDFVADNPGIQVEFTKAADFDAMKQSVLASNQAGDDFDLLFVNHVDTLSFIKGEIIQPITPLAEADDVDYSSIIYESLLEACMYEDVQYSVPVNTDTRVLAVNKDLFDKYSLEYPTTQEDMLAVAKTMSEGGDFGFVNSMTRSAYVPEYEQGVFLMGNGGRLYEIEDGKAVATIDTPEMRDFLNFNLELLNYMPKDCLTMTEDDGRKSFMSGTVGMYIYGPWEFTLMEDTEFEYELIKIPAGSKESASTSGGYQLAIGKNAANTDAAWQLMKYLTTNPAAMAAAGSTGLPTSEAAYGEEPFTDPKYDIFKEQLATSYVPEVPVANLNEVVEEFSVYWQDLLYGKITVDELCTGAQESVQKLLDETN